MEVLLLSLKTYDFTNDKNERVQGAKISYVMTEKVQEDGLCGFPPIQTSINNETYKKISAVPGLYDFQFEMKPGKNNKAEMFLKDVNFVQEIDFTKCIK